MTSYRLHRIRAPRRLSVAVGLSLLTPGLGHVYCGQLRRGLAVLGAALVVLLTLLVGWARWLFLPVVPAGILALAWVAVSAALIGDLARWTRLHGAAYELRPFNHPLTYVGLFLGLWVLPLVLGGGAVSTFWVGSVEVRDAAMFPRLLLGDRLFYERRAYVQRGPAPGDLVVLAPRDRPRTVGRVIATAGSVVQLRGARPVVDGASIPRRPVEGLRVPRFGVGPMGHRLAGLEGFLERIGGVEHLVTYPRARSLGGEPAPITLGVDELFVLGDNRAGGEGLRYPLSAVLGRPRCIWASFDERGALRHGRAGLELR